MWDACSDARVIFNQQKPHNLNPAGQSPAPEQEVTSDDIIGSSYHDNKEASTTLDDVMGYVVENRVVMSSLVRVLERECGGVEVKRGMRLREVNRHEVRGKSGSGEGVWGVERECGGGEGVWGVERECGSGEGVWECGSA